MRGSALKGRKIYLLSASKFCLLSAPKLLGAMETNPPHLSEIFLLAICYLAASLPAPSQGEANEEAEKKKSER